MKSNYISTCKYYLFLTLSVLVNSCASKDSNSCLIELNKNNLVVIEGFGFSAIADSILYLNLETNQNCLIKKIEDIRYVDDKLFVLNDIDGDKEILVFNNQGSFLNRIGREGNGPEEYLAISSIGINTYTKQIVILDPYKEQIHKYDYLGNFIRSIPIKVECAYIQKVRFVSNTRMRYVQRINARSSTLIAESNEDLSDVEILWKTNCYFEGGFNYANNPISATGNFFIVPFSDAIYQYDNGVLIPVVNVDNSNYKPNKEFENGGEYRKLFFEAVKKGYIAPSKIYECYKYLLIDKQGFILWDKKTKQAFSIAHTTYQPSIDIIPLSKFSTIADFENGFLGVLEASELLNLKEYCQKEGIKPSQKLEKLLLDIDIENNPSICVYFIKD